ncbi:MAG TPA: hypothetical protein DGR79_02910 [Clostridiales bacterium]|nr:hypothetical protein [Clostridiales bacterium]
MRLMPWVESPRVKRALVLVLTGAILAVGLVVYAYEAYPFGWPIGRTMAGHEYEVVLHSVEQGGDRVNVYVTVRWVGGSPVPYFGYWGQWLQLPSGERLSTSLHIRGADRWQELLRRSAARIEFDAPDVSGPALLILRFHLHGRGLECALPIDIPGG